MLKFCYGSEKTEKCCFSWGPYESVQGKECLEQVLCKTLFCNPRTPLRCGTWAGDRRQAVGEVAYRHAQLKHVFLQEKQPEIG